MLFGFKKQIFIALAYFVIAAFFGVILRLFYAVEIPINYKFFIHTHSHIALLGWVYLALTTILYILYLNNQKASKKYKYLFIFTQITLVGMLISFPFQGYAFFSIIFSTLFLFASYWFTWFFLKYSPKDIKKTFSYKTIKIALGYLVISSIGPWALGAIMTILGPLSIWYRLAIYFYLHFLYNGWMLLALLGLFFYILEQKNSMLNQRGFNFFFWILNVGIVLTFFLSTLWTNPSIIFNVLGLIGAIFQATAFIFLGNFVIKKAANFKTFFSNFQLIILKIVGFLLVIKIILQTASAFPFVANLATNYLDFTIGYLHLTFLGVVCLSLFLLLDFFKIFFINTKLFFLYLFGFLLTEFLIFYKGFAAWQKLPLFTYYFEVLTAGSLIILLSLFLMLFQSRNGIKEYVQQ